MWEIESPPYAVVREAELSMLSSSMRGDQRALSTMLSPDFAEIGRSGRRWTYSDIVPMLLEEEPRATPTTSEWQFNRVSPELILVTYRLHGAAGDSRHSSLWEMPGPVLRFHQGTRITAA